VVNTYVIQFHKGEPKASEVVIQFECEASSDMPATRYRVFLEKNIDIDYDFTICSQKSYLEKEGLL
jgi:hypothetical protein